MRIESCEFHQTLNANILGVRDSNVMKSFSEMANYYLLPKHEKAATFFSHTGSFLSDTHQSMKTSDSNLKVNRNIYPDAVTCDRMRLIGPKSGQLRPINYCLLEESQ